MADLRSIESAASLARFTSMLELADQLVLAGDFASAIPLVECCIAEAYAAFRLDTAYQLEQTLPTLRRGAWRTADA